EVASALQRSNVATPAVFDRYAKTTGIPAAPEPTNVLFDIDEVLEQFELRPPSSKPQGRIETKVTFEDLCYDVSPGGSLTLRVNDTDYSATFRFERNRRKYSLECDELERRCVAARGRSDNLIAFVNREQAFRVIPKASHRIYAHSRFYEPRLSLSATSQPMVELLKIVSACSQLDAPLTEKGGANTAS